MLTQGMFLKVYLKQAKFNQDGKISVHIFIRPPVANILDYFSQYEPQLDISFDK